MFTQAYDVIVVGGGHAGCEAANASAKMGSRVLLITMNLQNIAQMSCNPAMGGVAKGQIVREIDALGGLSGIITDKTMIQFKMLNRSKGPAMWSPRAQSDRMRFAEAWRLALEKNPRVDLLQDRVDHLIIKAGRVEGVKTTLGISIFSSSVILTNGTFLNGIIHVGLQRFGGGRMGDPSATGLTEQLIDLGFSSGRMKTGTPPRVDGRSLDYSQMIEQPGDEDPQGFSFLKKHKLKEQRSCYITYTNAKVHDILEGGFNQSPMFTGLIEGIGPRYCPSIEDKINRFKDKDRHQIFVEPEGWHTAEVYVNGFSTSLPHQIQAKAIREIPGFKECKIYRPGYAIEYDYFPPTQLKHTLETKLIEGLYFAGQINGTTGYEEAAAQGLMAGINANLKTNQKEPLILGRDNAYIGVLIDDLITKGTQEPYRMFTSRAEYRILLRQDNADERLTQIGHSIGLAEDLRLIQLEKKIKETRCFVSFMQQKSAEPKEINVLLTECISPNINQKAKYSRILARPQVALKNMLNLDGISAFLKENPTSPEALNQAEIQLKYRGYIEKEKENADKLKRLENLKIPQDFNYKDIQAISFEAREKLDHIKPATIAQAARISGVSPSDISVLLIYLGR